MFRLPPDVPTAARYHFDVAFHDGGYAIETLFVHTTNDDERLTCNAFWYNSRMVEWSFDTRDAQAARNARREFVNRMHSWYGDVANESAAELVLGELIGNAARYAPGLARVRADFDEAGVTIAVHDRGAGFYMPCGRSVNLLDESGRGLAIVAQFARSIDIDCAIGNGCCVRARLDISRLK